MTDREERVERERGLPFDLGRTVARGYRQVSRRPKDGHIFIDAARD